MLYIIPQKYFIQDPRQQKLHDYIITHMKQNLLGHLSKGEDIKHFYAWAQKQHTTYMPSAKPRCMAPLKRIKKFVRTTIFARVHSLVTKYSFVPFFYTQNRVLSKGIQSTQMQSCQHSELKVQDLWVQSTVLHIKFGSSTSRSRDQSTVTTSYLLLDYSGYYKVIIQRQYPQ